jgi:hypothetical protein
VTVEFWGQRFKVNIVFGCIGAFLIAVVSSMLGFSGGPFLVPLLTVGLGLPMYLVLGSSLLAILFHTILESSRHILFGNFDVVMFLIMFPAAMAGGLIAPQIAKRVSPIWVKRIAVAGLVVVGLNLLGVW